MGEYLLMVVAIGMTAHIELENLLVVVPEASCADLYVLSADVAVPEHDFLHFGWFFLE
jgi:hypothetical protein